MLGFFCVYGKNVSHCQAIRMLVWLLTDPPLVLCWKRGKTKVSLELCTGSLNAQAIEL